MNFTYCFIENGIKASEDVDTSKISSIKAGGTARIGVYPETVAALIRSIRICRLIDLKFKIIGGCSNTFFFDGYYDGVIIFTKYIDSVKICDGYVSAECGCTVAKLLKTAADSDLEVRSSLFGIPGTVGGALRNNAGAFDGEISQVFKDGLFMDTDTLEVFRLNGNDLDFGYRRSIIAHEPLVFLNGSFYASKRSKALIRDDFRKYAELRRTSHPSLPSLGSFFKRSGNTVPAELIDKAGLKGHRIGDAAVSDKHAGFIVNLGGATASDIDLLAENIKIKIKDKYNVELQREAELVK